MEHRFGLRLLARLEICFMTSNDSNEPLMKKNDFPEPLDEAGEINAGAQTRSQTCGISAVSTCCVRMSKWVRAVG